jgi:endonuclease G, mitochondrial
MKKYLILLILTIFNIHLFAQVKNISNATNSVTNYYLQKLTYSMSYNASLGHANWVAWTLKASDISVNYCGCLFRQDDNLPEEIRKISRSAYNKTKYDRGHFCNSQARSQNANVNAETYVMTNAVPQTPNLNRGVWKKYEEMCQLWARNGETLTIYAGAIGKKGTLKKNSVNIPKQFWKVIFGHGAAPICLLFENDDTTDKAMIVELSYIERITNYKF